VKRLLLVVGILGVLVGLMAGTAAAATTTTVTYTGQGFNFDGTTHTLNDERCGVGTQSPANDGGTGQFANWNGTGSPYTTGQGYLVWVLTANGATSATLNLPAPAGTVNMINVGGTFKYASPYFNYAEITPDKVTATATYGGKAKGNVQLTVSHGCQPFETVGAWCSPGFWKNAQDAAWAHTGYTAASLFNNTVVPSFYVNAYGSDPFAPTLGTVLTTPGANTFGSAADPYGLNAFNATGAFLTNNIPGYQFDQSLIPAPGQDEDPLSCPIDNHGNFK
jgi:hypothetical protein